MEPAGLRRRARDGTLNTATHELTGPSNVQLSTLESHCAIPKFTIDLSLPPKHRYDDIAPRFRERVKEADLLGMLDDLLHSITGSQILGKGLRLAAKVALHHLYSPEETAELSGISSALGLPMYFLVAFNVLLDLLLGCTSGGARVLGPKKREFAESRILHFRTLDWGMDELRPLVVELDFVGFPGGPVVATTVTYLGYIGVLTGVRKGLSLSLNFRPYHDRSSWKARAAFRYHQAMVVLGRRRSISSVLRGLLLDPYPVDMMNGRRRGKERHDGGQEAEMVREADFEAIISSITKSTSTAAYLVLCSEQKVCVIEKDHRDAFVRKSADFLTAYNHDASDEKNRQQISAAAQQLIPGVDALGIVRVLDLSLDRKTHLEQLWHEGVRAFNRRFGGRGESVTSMDVLRLVKDPKISNDETHFAVIMDPRAGKVIWRELYKCAEAWDSSSSAEL